VVTNFCEKLFFTAERERQKDGGIVLRADNILRYNVANPSLLPISPPTPTPHPHPILFNWR
jgi:hypothetical protein